jgi:hypothetical protein
MIMFTYEVQQVEVVRLPPGFMNTTPVEESPPPPGPKNTFFKHVMFLVIIVGLLIWGVFAEKERRDSLLKKEITPWHYGTWKSDSMTLRFGPGISECISELTGHARIQTLQDMEVHGNVILFTVEDVPDAQGKVRYSPRQYLLELDLEVPNLAKLYKLYGKHQYSFDHKTNEQGEFYTIPRDWAERHTFLGTFHLIPGYERKKHGST